jgi:hypothetical protein
MKIYFKYLFISISLLTASNAFSQVGIGTSTPAASAALEVTSDANNKGILIPRITATQKDAISSPAQGLLIYQTTAPSGFYYYSGTAWKLIVNQADTDLKVDKVTGKDLSTNDYTTAEKTKLAAITGTNTGDQTTITGNAGTATKLAASKNINGVAFDGSSDITVAAAAGTLTGIVAIANGGTNSTAVATAGGIGYGTGTAHAYTGAGSSGQLLSSTGAGAPRWITPPTGGIPYTGANAAVNLGAYDLTVNGLTIGKGTGQNDQNTAIGGGALYSSNSSGTRNTAVGFFALKDYKGTSFDNNTGVGYANMIGLTTGGGNTSVGAETMFNVASGSNNTAIGNQSLISTSGNNNVGVGTRSGDNLTTGSNNTFLGTQARTTSAGATISNSTAIGYGAEVGTDNTIQLGNASVSNVITSGTLTAGSITYPKVSGTNGQVLTTDGNGTASWGSVSAPAGNTFVTNIAGPINTSNYNPGDVVYDRSAGTFYLFKSPKQSSLGFTGANSNFSFFDFGKNVIRMRPTVTGNITSISLEIYNATNAVFSIYSSLSACAPGGGAFNSTIATVNTSTLLGSSNSNSGNGILTFTFSSPISVTANTDYYLTVSSAVNSVGSIRVKTGVNDSDFSISYNTCSIDQGSPSVQIIYATSYSTL